MRRVPARFRRVKGSTIDLWPPQRKVLEVIIFLLSSIAAAMALVMVARARKDSGWRGGGVK